MRTRMLGTMLAGLTLAGLLSVSVARAGATTASISRIAAPAPAGTAPAPRRPHRVPAVEGCFEPPPEPVAVPPCTDAAAPTHTKRSTP